VGKPDPLSREAFFQWPGHAGPIDENRSDRVRRRERAIFRLGAAARRAGWPRGEGYDRGTVRTTAAVWECRLPVSTPARPAGGGDLVGERVEVHRAVAESHPASSSRQARVCLSSFSPSSSG